MIECAILVAIVAMLGVVLVDAVLWARALGRSRRIGRDPTIGQDQHREARRAITDAAQVARRRQLHAVVSLTERRRTAAEERID